MQDLDEQNKMERREAVLNPEEEKVQQLNQDLSNEEEQSEENRNNCIEISIFKSNTAGELEEISKKNLLSNVYTSSLPAKEQNLSAF